MRGQWSSCPAGEEKTPCWHAGIGSRPPRARSTRKSERPALHAARWCTARTGRPPPTGKTVRHQRRQEEQPDAQVRMGCLSLDFLAPPCLQARYTTPHQKHLQPNAQSRQAHDNPKRWGEGGREHLLLLNHHGHLSGAAPPLLKDPLRPRPLSKPIARYGIRGHIFPMKHKRVVGLHTEEASPGGSPASSLTNGPPQHPMGEFSRKLFHQSAVRE